MRFTVGQLAKVYKISAQAIHGYVDMGILPCVRDDNGYRYFDDYGFQILGTIIKNRNIGFPLKESSYVYDNSSLEEIMERLSEQERKVNDELLDLMTQVRQLDFDKHLLQRAATQKDVPVLVDMDKTFRYLLGNNTKNIKEFIKEDCTSVSLWYSNLFYQSENLEIVEAGKAISIVTAYKNEVNINQLESLIKHSLVKYPEYCIKSDPFTRLVTSYRDELCEKVNIIELMIPVKKI